MPSPNLGDAVTNPRETRVQCPDSPHCPPYFKRVLTPDYLTKSLGAVSGHSILTMSLPIIQNRLSLSKAAPKCHSVKEGHRQVSGAEVSFL